MLSLQSRRNIVASSSVKGAVTANLYNVTFEEALTAILDSNDCGWRENGQFIYVYTNAELTEMAMAAKPVTTRIFRLHYARAEDIQVLVQGALSEIGAIAVTPAAERGIAPNTEEAGGNALATGDCLVVTDVPERIAAIATLISDLDVRPQQVLIEATIMRADLNEDNDIGIDFALVGGVDFQNLSSESTAITNISIGDLPADDFQKSTFTTQTDFAGNVPDGGLTFGLIKDSIAVFLRALEQVTDVTVMANPKILTLNKHRGEMIVGRRDGYLTTTVTETAAVQNVEFLETGTRLIFRPYIGADGYIRMEVHPEDSTGGITAANLPFEQTTEVTTNILVKDGHTILIGGLFREVTSATRSQVPLLGNIPVAGTLVRNTSDTTTREEIIILLTVHIVKDDNAYAEAGAELAEDVERYRVGMRQGLQWFGRERLSQAHYHWALEHLDAGNTEKALWDLNLAINNNPKMLPAIKLKEKLEGKRQYSNEGSSVRDFLIKEIMREQGAVTPLFGRPSTSSEPPAIIGPHGFEDVAIDEKHTTTSDDADAKVSSEPGGEF
jgi:type IV pilus assembly protein PilQ